MPKRPQEHILEDISRRKFEAILPEEWVFRNKDKDYGIDAEVEIFNKDHESEGLLFYVQLKATDAINSKDILSVSMKIDTLNYYRKLKIPVLLVRYSNKNDAIYHKWIDNFDLYTKEKQKTVTIKLSEADVWRSNTAILLKQHLENNKFVKHGDIKFPITYSIKFKEPINKSSEAVLKASIKGNIKNEYSDYLLYNQFDALLQISIANNSLKLDISNVGGCVMHNVNFEEDIIKLTKRIGVALVISLFAINKPDYAAKVLFENQLEEDLFFEDKMMFLRFLYRLLLSSYFNETIRFIEKILKDDKDEELNVYIKACLLRIARTKNKTKLAEIERLLAKELQNAEKQNDKQQIGIANYNIGNFYKSRNDYSKAITHYMLAKRNAPIYKKQYYFYSEIGGMLYEMNRFGCASSFYKKAIQIKALPKLKALYADALLFSGEYLQAQIMYNEYLDTVNKDADPEYFLKNLCLIKLIHLTKIERQEREIDEANKLAFVCDIEDDELITNLLEQSLNLDLLCSTAWFNLGILKIEDLEMSSFYFLLAAIISPYDIEAWCKATILNFYLTPDLSLIWIIRTAYTVNRDSYLVALYSDIENKMEEDSAIKLIDCIDEIIKEIGNEDLSSMEVRVMNNEEVFFKIL